MWMFNLKINISMMVTHEIEWSVIDSKDVLQIDWGVGHP